jgi:hypothetical protein
VGGEKREKVAEVSHTICTTQYNTAPFNYLICVLLYTGVTNTTAVLLRTMKDAESAVDGIHKI